MRKNKKRVRTRARVVPAPPPQAPAVVKVAQAIAGIQANLSRIAHRVGRMDVEYERLENEQASLESMRLQLLREFDKVA